MTHVVRVLSFVFAALIGCQVHALTEQEKQQYLAIRNNVFGGSQLAGAFQHATITGQTPPIFALNAAQRGLLVWQINANHLDDFSAYINLPQHLQLTQMPALTSFNNNANTDTSSGPKQQLSYYLIADIAETSRAEQGLKVEFKTFVRLPDNNIATYRFASYKATVGTDLVEIAATSATDISLMSNDSHWQGQMHTESGSLVWQADKLQPKKSTPLSGQYKKQGGINVTLSEAFIKASEQVVAPSGSASRYFYDGSLVSARLLNIKPTQLSVQNSFAWGNYIEAGAELLLFSDQVEYLVQPQTVPVNEQTNPNSEQTKQLFSSLLGMALSGQPAQSVFGVLFSTAANQPEVLPPQNIATVYYGLLDVYQSLQLFAGIEPPKLFFSLEEQPKTLFVNFEIPADKVKAFEQRFLPEHFSLAKIRFYPQQKQPVYAISLNVYQSRGQNLTGFRAEWSTYILNFDEPTPKPRFFILEAQSSSAGFDPIIAMERYSPDLDLTDPGDVVKLIEPPAEVFQFDVNEQGSIRVNLIDVAESINVQIDIAYPTADSILSTRPLKQWMQANDLVYWGEVADVLKYDENVMFADILVFDAKDSDVIIDSTFKDYVNPKPLPIILWDQIQDIALEPWGNLDTIKVRD
ncbi:hypothetical protein [Thalassotalea ponticola]